MPLFDFGTRRSALRQRRDPTAERFGNLSLEALVAECPTAIRGCTQVLDKGAVERGPKQGLVCLLTIGRRAADPLVKLMTGEERIRSPSPCAR